MYFSFTKDTLEGIGDFLKIGIPNTTMLCLEWWFYEILALMAGYISVEAVGS